ncbi:arsenate reductase (azurin) small subunit [Rhodophyticola porphyridii]|uniref:Arsenate reductase (Azurin) small subunit n=1 Tax=Rhodophyticola porphyridii TaxID=1852017 RepID=A0A3L9Y7I9_9RHOB|nr:arsenate reductase (azurin) small subunit [Rhodophyticola porphyridii]RMA42283.1 arsenate reductase (azurin) small subunit [Rhodophyticola porphyridii]
MTQKAKAEGVGQKHPCSAVSRRQFLILGGASVAVLATYGTGAGAQQLVSSSYVRTVVGKVSELVPGEATTFLYPNDDVENVLVMLGEEAGGGVGEGRNIVAFNTICPHMGGYMGAADFHAEHSVLGPCPLHLSTFDLTKHGMIVSGHAVESLPQIVLEIDGDDIVATGVMGLFYGYNQNPSGEA